jgi:hypothetical protein
MIKIHEDFRLVVLEEIKKKNAPHDVDPDLCGKKAARQTEPAPGLVDSECQSSYRAAATL